MANKKAVIIGSGIGGLACAIRLKKKGYDVTVFEAQEKAGGKIGEIKIDGFRFDTGATCFTLPFYLEELFSYAGYNLSDFLTYNKLPAVNKYFYTDGVMLTAWADIDRFASETQAKTSEPKQNIINYLNKNRKLFESLEKQFENPKSLKSANALNSIFNGGLIGNFRSTHSANESAFKNRKVQMLFDHFAVSSGSHPYKMPSTLNYLPHVEHNLGVHYIKGGIYRIIEAMALLCKKMGVVINYNSKVERIATTNNQVSGIILNNEHIKSDIVVSNVDIHSTYTYLLPEIKYKIDKEELSNSAIVFYWGIKRPFPQLGAHNIFFSRYNHEEFDALFNNYNELFQDNTVYLNITSKYEPGDAPEGCENWQAIINVPVNNGQSWDKFVDIAREQILGKIGLILNENVQGMIKCENVLTAPMIEAKTGSYLGSLYGNNLNSQTAAFSRLSNISSKFKNLYFCGGTVTPGGGIPFCLISAKNVSELITE